MTKSTFNYSYDTTVREIYDLTEKEAEKIYEEEKRIAKEKKHVLILTSKGYENRSFFDAYSADKITHSFTWIHFCPQDILGFDDDSPQEGKYYILVLENVVKKAGNV